MTDVDRRTCDVLRHPVPTRSRAATSRSCSARTVRAASRPSSPSTPPPWAPPSAAPASTRTPPRRRPSPTRSNLVARHVVQERPGRARPRRRQGRDHRRPGHAASPRSCCCAYGRFVASLGGRYVHRLRRRHLRRGHGRRRPRVPLDAPAARPRTAAPATPRCSPPSASSRACGPPPQHLWGDPTLRGRRVGVAGVGKVGHHLVEHLLRGRRRGRDHGRPRATRWRGSSTRTRRSTAVADAEALIRAERWTSTRPARSAGR